MIDPFFWRTFYSANVYVCLSLSLSLSLCFSHTQCPTHRTSFLWRGLHLHSAHNVMGIRPRYSVHTHTLLFLLWREPAKASQSILFLLNFVCVTAFSRPLFFLFHPTLTQLFRAEHHSNSSCDRAEMLCLFSCIKLSACELSNVKGDAATK